MRCLTQKAQFASQTDYKTDHAGQGQDSCLVCLPSEILKDPIAAWDYLDSIYGDPRFIADNITQDISKFKALQDGEDGWFCELVHLVNRSYNTLKEVRRPNDMNNNYMIALIEQKMSNDDRKVWARDLERDKKKAILENILSWMTAVPHESSNPSTIQKEVQCQLFRTR